MAKEYPHKAPLVSISQVLEDAGIKFRENSTSQLIMDECYNCHRSKKMYVNKDTGVYNCFYCNAKGNPVALLHHYLQIPFKKASQMLYGKEARQKASIKAVQEEDETEDKFIISPGLLKNLSKKTKDLDLPDSLQLPPEFKPLTEQHPAAWEYLLKRGYTPDVIHKLKLFIIPQPTFQDAWKVVEQRLIKEGTTGPQLKEEITKVVRYHGRIIFPLYVEHQVMGLVARDYTGTKDPKVLNSSGGFRSYAVWNFDNASQSKKLVICEGNSSAVKCGVDRSIALLGKVATPGQIRLIRKMAAEQIYICLDVGTDNEQSELYKSLSNYYPGKIFKVELPAVIPLKLTITPEQVATIKKVFPVDLRLETSELAYLPYADKAEILRIAKIKPKWMKEEKIEAFTKFVEQAGLDVEIRTFLVWLLFKAEYKDAGDYTPAEMDQFIAAALLFQGGIDLDD